MFYRDYNRFDQKKFKTELNLNLQTNYVTHLRGSVPRNFKQDCTS